MTGRVNELGDTGADGVGAKRWTTGQQHKLGDPLSFAVPTGNFGDVLAGYVAGCVGGGGVCV